MYIIVRVLGIDSQQMLFSFICYSSLLFFDLHTIQTEFSRSTRSLSLSPYNLFISFFLSVILRMCSEGEKWLFVLFIIAFGHFSY